MRRSLFIVTAIVIGSLGVVAGLIVGTQTGTGPTRQASNGTTRPQDQGSANTIFFEPGTLLGGSDVPLPQVPQLLSDCSCIGPSASSAPLSIPNIVRAQTNATDQIALTFRSSAVLIDTPDSRTPEQYGEDAAQMVQSGEPWQTLELRGTIALATDADSSGPASLSWVESEHLVQLIDYSGGSLSNLIVEATALPAPGQPAASRAATFGLF